MRYLEELEEKVLRLIQRHKELQARFDALIKENEHLKNQAKQTETNLNKDAHELQLLAQEKATLLSGIEELVKSISALENDAR